MRFKLEYKFFSKKETRFVLWFISHKLIFNEIPWFEIGIWSKVATAWLARRNTIANAEQSKKSFSIFFLLMQSRASLNEYFTE